MKFRMGVLVVASFCLSLGSCNHASFNAKPYPVTKNIVRLTDENMPPVEYFSLEKIALPEKYAEAEYSVYNDSIAVIVNSDHPDPYIVTIFNLNTGKEFAGYFKKGQGPDEMISVMARIHRNCLYVLDLATNAVSRLNIDSVLAQGDAYHPVCIDLDCLMVSNNFIFEGNDTITMANPMYVSNDLGVEDIPEFMQFDAKTGLPVANYKINDQNYPANLVQRSIVRCDSNYVVFWGVYPIITIYDKKFNLVKMYRDDKFDDPELVSEGSDAPMLSASGISLFFALGCQTENYFLARNFRCQISGIDLERKGGLNWLRSDESRFGRYKDTEIWCFDNKANLVRRFKCSKTITIAKISYNEKSDKLYLTAKDENDEYCLYKCIFEK